MTFKSVRASFYFLREMEFSLTLQTLHKQRTHCLIEDFQKHSKTKSIAEPLVLPITKLLIVNLVVMAYKALLRPVPCKTPFF